MLWGYKCEIVREDDELYFFINELGIERSVFKDSIKGLGKDLEFLNKKGNLSLF